MGPDPNQVVRHRGPVSLVAAGAFALVVVVMLVWLLTTPSSPPASSRRGARPAASTTGPRTSKPTATVTSTTTSPAASVQNQAPTDVHWLLYQGVALPFSSANGPRTIHGDVARGYAHDPEGALLAAAQIGVRYLVAPDWQAVTATSVAPGPGRNAYVVLRQSQDPSAQATAASTVPQGAPGPGTYLQLAGYQFVTYTPQTAVLQLISQGSSGTYQVTTSTVSWSGSDWKLVLQADGSSSPSAQAVSSLAQIHLRTGNIEQAEGQARHALQLLEGHEDYLDETGNAQLVLGRALLEQGRLDEAETAFGNAEASFDQLGSASHRAAAWVARGDLAARRGDDRLAAHLYRTAAEALQDVRF